MRKRERLELIKTIVSQHAIETQNELVRLLEAEGLQATQATISRDINEVGIIKVPAGDGRYIYGLSKEQAGTEMVSPTPTTRGITGLAQLDNQLHIDVVPGNSRLIKRQLLQSFGQSIFSLIADDDSLLLIAPSSEQAAAIGQEIEQWLDKP